MISIVIVSHSKTLADGVVELCHMLKSDCPIFAAGGMDDNSLGTSYSKILSVVENVYTKDGVIILYDVGSSKMTSEMVIEELKSKGLDKIRIIDCPLVEGAIQAAFDIYQTSNIDELDLSKSLEK